MIEIKNILDALEKDASESMKRLIDLDYNYVDYDTINGIYANRFYMVKMLIDFINEAGFRAYDCNKVKDKFLELTQEFIKTDINSELPTNLVNKLSLIQDLIKSDYKL